MPKLLKKTALCLLLLMIVVMAVAGFKYCRFRSGFADAASLEQYELHEGDLIFRKGRSIESFAVCVLDPVKGYSHAGMIVNQDGKACVVHAVPGESGEGEERLKLESPASFLAGDKASSYAVYRPDFSSGSLHQAAMAALEYYRRGCTFDHEYSFDTEDKLYCTELILKAYAKAGLQIRDVKPSALDLGITRVRVVLPGAFLMSPSFKKIMDYGTINP